MKSDNPHFEFPADWAQAGELVDFEPVQPVHTAGFELVSLAVFIRDHRQRELPRGERSLEAHYGDFVLTQACPGRDKARRLALQTPYGVAPRSGSIAGREARIYELGAAVAADDIDARSPAVVAWCDGDRFYLIASSAMSADGLLTIAESIY